MLYNPLLRRKVFIMGGTTKWKVTGKYKEFLSLSITSLPVPHRQGFFTMAKFRLLLLKCLPNVTVYLWPSCLEQQQLPR